MFESGYDFSSVFLFYFIFLFVCERCGYLTQKYRSSLDIDIVLMSLVICIYPLTIFTRSDKFPYFSVDHLLFFYHQFLLCLMFIYLLLMFLGFVCLFDVVTSYMLEILAHCRHCVFIFYLATLAPIANRATLFIYMHAWRRWCIIRLSKPVHTFPSIVSINRPLLQKTKQTLSKKNKTKKKPKNKQKKHIFIYQQKKQKNFTLIKKVYFFNYLFCQ